MAYKTYKVCDMISHRTYGVRRDQIRQMEAPLDFDGKEKWFVKEHGCEMTEVDDNEIEQRLKNLDDPQYWRKKREEGEKEILDSYNWNYQASSDLNSFVNEFDRRNRIDVDSLTQMDPYTLLETLDKDAFKGNEKISDALSILVPDEGPAMLCVDYIDKYCNRKRLCAMRYTDLLWMQSTVMDAFVDSKRSIVELCSPHKEA